jgi:phosphatidylserine/phosphatidylglycerophosphate/cardiolipin synthase-like enzyme
VTVAYATAAGRLNWLMDALETKLDSLPNGSVITSEFVRSSCPGRRSTADEAAVVLGALEDIEVVTMGPNGYILQGSGLAMTARFRAGVRAGLAVRTEPDPGVRLCAALPSGLPAAVESALRIRTEDLRGVVVDLVAGAREELVLVSPFWDAATVDEIGPMLLQRLGAGVRVRVLGRFGTGTPTIESNALARLALHPRCHLLSWYEASQDDPFGARTFHFKAAIADSGLRAYLGTANFTTSGLRSRLEIGVILEGAAACRLAEIAEAVLTLARPVTPGASI